MKLVRFNRALLPWQEGEERVLPDDVARRLAAAGDGVILPSPFDAAGGAPGAAPAPPARPRRSPIRSHSP